MTLGKVSHKIGTALQTLYCRVMNKTDPRNDIAAGIRGFCIANPEADFEMVMDFVDAQIVPFEADDDLCDLAMMIMLDVDESNQST
ncbi:hypothetical protein S-MbCM7_065 [Synechococcus phage ACG-2014h]|uniref:Uncharacterized protein n=1 Tax=Synechococcus phage ACG-2014h TaxID=1340810 RepID=V5UTS2_9CAUD|nr:hypothetical protein S-MbCM7_065 [Synechococcus phage ACG-2014h]AHB80479.1 hypothetical protein S-MbCM7_065 [Synechococcus phage ACG-2014h]